MLVKKGSRPEIPLEVRAQMRVKENGLAVANLFREYRNMMERAPIIVQCVDLDDGPLHFRINDEARMATESVRRVTNNEKFVVVGANISENYDIYNQQQLDKISKFYRILEEAGLDTKLSFTLARISGFMRPRFFASCNPPLAVKETVAKIQNVACEYLSKLLKFPAADHDYSHSRFGLAIPDYVRTHSILYEESRNTVLGVRQQVVELVNIKPAALTEDRTAWLAAQTTAPWMVCNSNTTAREHLTGVEFRFALAIRCGTLPSDVLCNTPSCSCPVKFNSVLDGIKHAMNCTCNGFGPPTRHNLLKTAIAEVVAHYGFTTQVEPTNYCNEYLDGVNHRPDLLVFSLKPVCTDFVVSQQRGSEPGPASRAAADKKNNHHRLVVARHGQCSMQ